MGDLTPAEPASSEPAGSEPASSEPASSEPASSEPASSEPASSEPASSADTKADRKAAAREAREAAKQSKQAAREAAEQSKRTAREAAEQSKQAAREAKRLARENQQAREADKKADKKAAEESRRAAKEAEQAAKQAKEAARKASRAERKTRAADSVPAAPSVLEARRVSVRSPRRRLLEPTSLEVRTGEVLLVSGDPGHGHTCLALLLGGRLLPDRGIVNLDGQPEPKMRQSAVALVDLPGVTAPDEQNRLTTIVGEELAMAGRPAGRRHVRNWLRENGFGDTVGQRIEQLPGMVRVAVLAKLAVLRESIRFVVITLPETHGGLPEWWLQIAEDLAADGYGVIITASPSTAAGLDVRTVELGGAIAEVPA